MRTCGTCSLCCKLPGVYTLPEQTPALTKPPNQWCQHCKVGSGCGIYDNRPQPCRNFDCLWLVHPEMAEELRPDRSHVIMYGLSEEDKAKFNSDVVVMEDPQYFTPRESLKGRLVGTAVRQMLNSGLRIHLVNKEQISALSRG